MFRFILVGGLAATAHAFPGGRPIGQAGQHGSSGRPDGSNAAAPSGGPGEFRESGLSICDNYATSILGANNRDTQELLMTLFTNTAAAGNYTPSSLLTGVSVSGFVNPGYYHGHLVDQRPYFNGEFNSTNATPDQGHGIAVDWLDGGGPAALHQNLSAFNVDSNQFFYFIHLYEYFAYLLGCSIYGNAVDRYNGSTDMYHVHKYMNINNDMEQYTNLQFVLSAASLGFSKGAQAYIGKALEWLFSFKCEPPKPFPEWAEPASQSICQAADCPTFPHNPQCPLEEVPKAQIVAAPGESKIRIYSCKNDTDDMDTPGDGCLGNPDGVK